MTQRENSSNVLPPGLTRPAAAARKKPVWPKVLYAMVVAAAAAYLFAVFTGQTQPKHDVEGECVRIVAEWAGVDAGDVTSRSVGTNSYALDFRGTYPGGEWACGGQRDQTAPNEVVVYPSDGAEGGRIFPPAP